MKTFYDVIIIGAGPAGISCARHLVENGVNTLIIEKKKLPRYKCCCGLLTLRAMGFINEKFGEIPGDIICNKNKIDLVYSDFFNEIDDLEHTKNWLNIDRSLLDIWLLQNSKCDFVDECNYIYHNKNKDGMEVYFKMKDKTSGLKCKYLIGADGGFSKVRRNIQTRFKLRKHLLAYQEEFSIDNFNQRNFNKHFYILNPDYSDFFAWFMQKNDVLLTGVSSIISKQKNNREKYMINLHQKIKERYEFKGKLVGKKAALLYYKHDDRYFFGENNVFFCGEASGLLTDSGEGITTALYSGYKLAEAIISAKNNNEINSLYSKSILNEIEYINNSNFLQKARGKLNTRITG